MVVSLVILDPIPSQCPPTLFLSLLGANAPSGSSRARRATCPAPGPCAPSILALSLLRRACNPRMHNPSSPCRRGLFSLVPPSRRPSSLSTTTATIDDMGGCCKKDGDNSSHQEAPTSRNERANTPKESLGDAAGCCEGSVCGCNGEPSLYSVLLRSYSSSICQMIASTN